MKALTRVDLFELVRDGTTVTGSQLVLLYHLAWRANRAKNYSCYPSYRRLAWDTHYTEQNLSIAARELEAAGYITRVKRPHRSNMYYLNVPLLQKLAEATLASRVADDDAEEILNPYELAEDDVPSAAPVAATAPVVPAPRAPGFPSDVSEADRRAWEEDNGIVLALEPRQAPSGARPSEGAHTEENGDKLPICNSVDELLALVQRIWLTHPTYDDPRGEEFLRKDLAACAKMAQTTVRCGHLLSHLYYHNDATIRSVGKSRKLGPYLKKMFPIWLQTYADKIVPVDYEIEVPSLLPSRSPFRYGS